MSAAPTTPEAYLAGLAADRRSVVEEVLAIARAVAPDARLTMKFRMPTLELERPLCAVAAQKHHFALYVCEAGVLDERRDDFSALDLGRGCLRFRRLEQLPRAATESLLAEAARRVRTGH
ncbi:MAG: DUF1801 domain-containing protein [Planctomycetota bacterium]